MVNFLIAGPVACKCILICSHAILHKKLYTQFIFSKSSLIIEVNNIISEIIINISLIMYDIPPIVGDYIINHYTDVIILKNCLPNAS